MTTRLPIETIFVDAIRLPWQERRAYLRGLAVPGGTLVAFYAAWWSAGDAEVASWMRWVLWAASWLVVMMFVISCHRLALLEQVRQSPDLFPPISRREALFAARLVCAGVLYFAAQWVVLTILANLGSGTLAPGTSGWGEAFWTAWIAEGVGMYVFARFALVFPATAIGEKTSFGEAWQSTRGNGWRMLVVVGAVPAAASYATGWLYSNAPGIGAAIAASAVIALFLAVEVTALSLSYKALRPQPSPEAPEPRSPSRTPGR